MDRSRSQQSNGTNSLFHERTPGLRTKRLAFGLSAALFSTGFMPASATSPFATIAAPHEAFRVAAEPRRPDQNPPQTWLVQNCDDSGPGSLRSVVTNVANSGDTVDLSQLNCSAITLGNAGQIVINQDDLYLLGPDAGPGSLTISGNDASRVFEHMGFGTLHVQSLTIAHGYEHESGANTIARGGCVYSKGSVDLNRSIVASCTATSDTTVARGGGIYTRADTSLVLSTVTGNHAIAPANRGWGGGIYSQHLYTKYSSVTANIAHDGMGGGGIGGGASSSHSTTLVGSTIDNNQAGAAGGLMSYAPVWIVNSTISENIADDAPALAIEGAADSSILNTTIALNQANSDTSSGAVYLKGQLASTTFSLQSSIIANNAKGASSTPSDLYFDYGVLTGADNLVITTNQSPPGLITVTADPKLGPLQFNGGWTRTHALLPGSPAIAMGNNVAGRVSDQRGAGYPRTTGAVASTDVGAFQFDTIFAGSFD